MARTMWKPAALALGAMLAVGGIATADDAARLGGSGTPAKSGFSGGVTLGGQGTIADAVAANDTELMHHRRHYGYGGGYYGGYRGYYGGGYGYYSSYSYAYRPVYYPPVYYRPVYYAPPVYYRPPVVVSFGGFYGGGFYGGYRGFYGGFYGISGDEADVQAPAVNLATPAPAPAATLPQPQPAPQPIPQPAGKFNYDGGPAAPVPLPATDPKSQPQAQPRPAVPGVTNLPTSLKPQPTTAPAKPYTFKPYGQK